MHSFPMIAQFLLSADARIQRQVKYWAATAALYALFTVILWFDVCLGETSVGPATWLTGCMIGGLLFFYGLIRSSTRWGLSSSQLAVYQGQFAIICIVVGYAISGPIRGATLAILLVVLVFCAFAVEAKQSYRLSIFAIVLLAATMIWMAKVEPARFKLQTEIVHFLFAAIALVAVAFITGKLSGLRTKLKTQKEELANALARAQVLATRDELTLLTNRSHMNALLAKEEERRRVLRQPICIALIDLDLFKHVNDTYGHAAGDVVLRSFAQEAQVALRASDILARWGGEEFLLCLPNTDLLAAKQILERLKSHISTLRFPDIASDLHITFSAGLIVLFDGESINEGINRADDAMYKAKSEGRNCIVVA